jgi:hypothetical protein
MRVLSLDADEVSLAFGLHEITSGGVATLFERVVGLARYRSLPAAALSALPGPASFKDAVLSAVKLAFGYGRLDAVGCRVRLKGREPVKEPLGQSDGPSMDLRLALASSIETMEFATELLPGVPVVAVFDTDIEADDSAGPGLDESSRIAVSAYRSASKSDR